MAARKARSQVKTYPTLTLTGRTEDGLSFWHYTWPWQDQIRTRAESELALLALFVETDVAKFDNCEAPRCSVNG